MKSKLIVIVCGLVMFGSGVMLGSKLRERRMYKDAEALCALAATHPLENALCLMQVFNFLDVLNGKNNENQ